MTLENHKGKVLILFNPVAGSGHAKLQSVCCAKQMKKQHWEIACSTITKKTLSEQKQFFNGWINEINRLIIIGGDGTIRHVISALPDENGIEIGIIPMGNANVIVRELNLPLDPHIANRIVCKSNKTKEFDLGILKTSDKKIEKFITMLEVGYGAIVAEIIASLRKGSFRKIYRSWADFVYLIAGVYALKQYTSKIDFKVEITRDVSLTDVNTAVFCNSRTYAKGWSYLPKASFGDGLLDLIVFRGTTPMSVMKMLILAISRNKYFSKNIEKLRAGKFEVKSKNYFPIQIDGEFIGYDTHIEISIEPKAIKFIII